MAKQLLIYDTVSPVNKKAHAELCINSTGNYDFADGVNSVPLTAVEFPKAAGEYSIVFAGQGEEITPVAIMGLREQENLFVQSDGSFSAEYVPAYLRRHPFVFSTADEGKNFTLCVDETARSCNKEGKGERLFDSTGEQTAYTGNVLSFLKEYQAHYSRTRVYCQKLKALDLFQPMGAQFKLVGGQKLTLTGFQIINREKLQNLPPEDLSALSKTGELELSYTHLQSLNNLNSLVKRIPLADGVSDTEKSEELEEPASL